MAEPQSKPWRAELTPVRFLERAAVVFADRTAVIHGGRVLTYGELALRCQRLASALARLGITRGDRVAVLSPNTPALLEVHFAVPALGAVLVALNTRLTRDEIAYIVGHSGARLVIVDAELTALVEGLDPELGVVRVDDTGAPGDPYEDLLASGSPGPIVAAVDDEEQVISINYTSGTTGRPKGVMYTHRGAYLNAMAQAVELSLTPESTFLWTLPMFHCNGWTAVWGVSAVGATHVCLRRADPDDVWDALERLPVTHYHSAPTVQISILAHPRARRLERPVLVSMGGAPPSPSLLARFEALNMAPNHLYGLTETYGPATKCHWRSEWDELDPSERAVLRARQGQAHVAAQPARVVDAELRDVPRDGETLGEVVMRGNTVTAGYHADPEATAEAFRGGWFHSGDLAVMHPDGTIELRDRAKDIIISGGENISTIEVEQTIARHPAVLECAVVAVPDDHWGERPKAFVTLRPGEAATGAELVEFCRTRLAHFKCPDTVEFTALPKTATGKIQKYVLRARALGRSAGPSGP